MPKFTPANAREMGKRGNLARWSRKSFPANLPAIVPPVADAYPQTQALKFRKQISRLLSLLEQANDSKDIVKLATAIDRLQTREAALSGRPSPGSLRHKARSEPRPSALIYVEPIPPLPAPAPDQPAPDGHEPK